MSFCNMWLKIPYGNVESTFVEVYRKCFGPKVYFSYLFSSFFDFRYDCCICSNHMEGVDMRYWKWISRGCRSFWKHGAWISEGKSVTVYSFCHSSLNKSWVISGALRVIFMYVGGFSCKLYIFFFYLLSFPMFSVLFPFSSS